MSEFKEIWVYLSASPLLHLTLTLIAFQIGNFLYRRSGLNPVCNPVMLAVIIIVAILGFTGTSYDTYFDGAQFVHFLLGPATVALAIPLYRQFDKVRKSALAIFVSLICGSLTASVSAVAIAWVMGAGELSIISIAPKSVTAPIAMGIVEQLGGLAIAHSGAGHPYRCVWVPCSARYCSMSWESPTGRPGLCPWNREPRDWHCPGHSGQ